MRRELLVGFLLVAAVTVVYWPVHSYPFVLLDDQSYVHENLVVRKGLTSEGVAYAFNHATVSNWHPLTMLSHMLDCQLFGGEDKNAGWHHLTNLFLHALNTLLLFIALRRMTGAVWRSGFVAALFGLHPLHVESVAWISERKDVLSMFFFMLLLLAYHHYAQRRTLLRYGSVFLLLALGLMSKPMLVTAPFVLLLLDYWPLGRMKFEPAGAGKAAEEPNEDEEPDDDEEFDEDEAESLGAGEPDDTEAGEPDDEADDAAETSATDDRMEPADSSDKRTLGWLIVEKIPLFVLALLSAWITLIVQGAGGAMSMLGQNLTLATRLANAVCGYGIYLEKSFWPHPLAAIYPYTTHRSIDVLIIGLALGAITYAAYRMAKIKPYLPVGWWWYLVTLLPVIGLVQVGVQSIADRYTYIPLIGVFIIAAWGSAELIEGLSRRARMAAVAAAVVTLAVFATLTRQQVTTWSSSEQLFSRAAAASPNNYVALDGLGMYYWQQGRLDDARKQFESILKIESDPRLHVEGGFEPAHRGLGLLLAVQHQPKQALEQFDIAIRLQPKLPDARRHKAWLLATYPDERIRNGKEAVQLAKEAIELSRWKPPELWDTLGVAQAETSNFEEAIKAEEKAIEVARQVHSDDDLLRAFQRRLEMFKEGFRYHAEPRRPTRI